MKASTIVPELLLFSIHKKLYHGLYNVRNQVLNRTREYVVALVVAVVVVLNEVMSRVTCDPKSLVQAWLL